MINNADKQEKATYSISDQCETNRTGHALYTTSSSTMTLRKSRRSPKVGKVSNTNWFSIFGDPGFSNLALFGDKVAWK